MLQAVFLDFDGVLHPGYSGTLRYREVFEGIMRDWPQVQIFLSTNWRQTHTLDDLRRLFSPDIAQRIVDVTPTLDAPHSRYDEILAACKEHAIEDWLALDDEAELFPPGCQNLIWLDKRMGLDQLGEAMARAVIASRF